LLLQTHEHVSDEEATARATFDLRWKAALGLPLETRPFAKSTLQLFRAQLIVHAQLQAVFKKSPTFARQTDYLQNRTIRVALDTTNIFGRGAVKDTYNLLADGIVKLARALAALATVNLDAWMLTHDLVRYGGSSLKGEVGIDWESVPARQVLLTAVVADADRLLEMARPALGDLTPNTTTHTLLSEEATLLGQILLQDVERIGDGARIIDGVAADRVVSVHDPETRHGRKSASKRFDRHNAAIAVDPESQLIMAATGPAGNAPDHTQARQLVEQSEANA
jgi:hypothetical protein